MRKILIVFIVFIFLSCNTGTGTTETAASDNAAAAASIEYSYTPDYSSSFEIGDPNHSETILKLWKAWDNGDLNVSKDLFADSVRIYTRDGSAMEGTRDSITAWAQAYRDGFSEVHSAVHAFVPLKSTDKNENWVVIWGKEYDTDKQGKVDSVELQETWRLNKDGKVDLMYQYGQAHLPAPSAN